MLCRRGGSEFRLSFIRNFCIIFHRVARIWRWFAKKMAKHPWTTLRFKSNQIKSLWRVKSNHFESNELSSHNHWFDLIWCRSWASSLWKMSSKNWSKKRSRHHSHSHHKSNQIEINQIKSGLIDWSLELRLPTKVFRFSDIFSHFQDEADTSSQAVSNLANSFYRKNVRDRVHRRSRTTERDLDRPLLADADADAQVCCTMPSFRCGRSRP